jgi:hypothetical protein
VHDPIVVLLAIDGVRWQEVFGGVMPDMARRHGLHAGELYPAAELTPNLHRLGAVDGCVLGAPGAGEGFFASGPDFVSLPGYSEMLTGSSRSGCTTNSCKSVRMPTLLDDFADCPGTTLEQAAVITSWPRIVSASSDGLRQSGVVSTGRSGGYHLERLRAFSRSQRAFEAGFKAGPAPGYDDFRPDRYTADLACAYLAEARPRFLFVSLGETDEHAHHDRYRSYLEALHFADGLVGRLRATLRDLEEQGVPTALLVTTDHGRANHFVDHGSKWPESSRSFLFAAGSLIVARGHVADAPRARLADLAPTVRALSGLKARETEGGGRVLEELRPSAFAAVARSRE